MAIILIVVFVSYSTTSESDLQSAALARKIREREKQDERQKQSPPMSNSPPTLQATIPDKTTGERALAELTNTLGFWFAMLVVILGLFGLGKLISSGNDRSYRKGMSVEEREIDDLREEQDSAENAHYQNSVR